MKFRPLIVALSVLAVVSATAALGGCSSNKSTNPPPVTTPESFDSGNLTTTFVHPFATATGSPFAYRCKYHSGAPNFMVGTVIVDPLSANTSASVNVANYAFSPPSVTVKPGSIVTWTLVSGVHTVTRP